MAIRFIETHPDAAFASHGPDMPSVVVVTDDVKRWASALLPLVAERYIACRAIEIAAETAITQQSDALFEVLGACKILSEGHSFVPGEAIVDEAAWRNLIDFADSQRRGQDEAA